MIQVTLYISFWCNLATPCEYVSFMYLQCFAKFKTVGLSKLHYIIFMDLENFDV